MIYLSNDILANCIQKGLRSNWLSDSAKNTAKNQKDLTIRKRNWINSFNSSLSIPIPIPIPFIQFLCNSNSWNWNWNWYQFQFQFRNWPQPWDSIHKMMSIYQPFNKTLWQNGDVPVLILQRLSKLALILRHRCGSTTTQKHTCVIAI